VRLGGGMTLARATFPRRNLRPKRRLSERLSEIPRLLRGRVCVVEVIVPSRNLLLRSLGAHLRELKPHLSPASYRAGDVLGEPGQRRDRVIFPTSGLISTRAVLESGHELEAGLIGRNNASGAPAAMGTGVALLRTVCLTDVHAWNIPMPRLQAAMRSALVIDVQVKRFSEAQIGYMLQVGICNAMHPLEQRLARWLTITADLLDGPEIQTPQEELAKGFGVQRSALNPLLQRLKAESLLDIGRGRLLIRDASRLRKRACECTPSLQRAMRVEPMLNCG